jgi:hypothetical protein
VPKSVSLFSPEVSLCRWFAFAPVRTMLAGARPKSPEQRPKCCEENPKTPANPAGSGRLLA